MCVEGVLTYTCHRFLSPKGMLTNVMFQGPEQHPPGCPLIYHNTAVTRTTGGRGHSSLFIDKIECFESHGDLVTAIYNP